MNKLPIIFQLEKDIFYLFSFLNLIGYNKENNLGGMHPLRESVRQRLKGVLKVNHYPLLKHCLLKKHRGQFVGWLLRKKYTPEELISTFSKQDLSFFQRFDRSFQKFVKGEEKILPWLEAKKLYSAEKKDRYQRIVKELNGLMKILNVDFSLFNLDKVVVVPNFLDAYNRGYGPTIGRAAFIVYGPLKNEKFSLIRHEFLHSIVNPLILNNKIFLTKLKKLFKYSQPGTKLKKEGYSNRAVIIEECLVRAIDIKAQSLGIKEKKELLKQERGKGFKYIERIYVKLKENYKRNELFDIFKNILNNL